MTLLTSTHLQESDLFDLIASDTALLNAWADIRAAGAKDGFLSRELRDFDRSVLSSLERLSSELSAGEWMPGHVKTWLLTSVVPPRTITESLVRDRIVEKATADVVSATVDLSLSPFSFAYRRGLGVRDAQNALNESLAAGWSHVVRTDIADAFDSVPRAGALAALTNALPDTRVHDVVAKLLGRLRGGLEGRGLPTGSALSPVLLNIYLDSLDRHIMRLDRLPIRYADDLAIPVDSADDGDRVVREVAECAGALGLELNSEKTRIVNVADGFDFLGKRIRADLLTAESDTFVHPQRVAMYVSEPGAVPNGYPHWSAHARTTTTNRHTDHRARRHARRPVPAPMPTRDRHPQQPRTHTKGYRQAQPPDDQPLDISASIHFCGRNSDKASTQATMSARRRMRQRTAPPVVD